jgi:hypothetical protein
MLHSSSRVNLKRKARFMISPFCLSPQITLEAISRFYEIQQEGHASEADLNAKIFNPSPSTTPKWRTFNRLRWLHRFAPVNVGL